MSPHAELMTFIGFTDGVKNWKFMRSTNRIFYATKAVFNESTFLHCPEGSHASIPAIETGVLSIDKQNIPPEDVDNNQTPPPPPVERDNTWWPRNPIPYIPRNGNGNQQPPYNVPLPNSRTKTRTFSHRPSRSITPSTNRDDVYMDENPTSEQPRHPLKWIPIPTGTNNPLQLRWMPCDTPNVPTTHDMEETTQRFWNRWCYWVPPVNNWHAPVQNIPERPPSPENIPGPSNIQPAQEGPRWMSRVRQPRQLPENVYGQTPVVTEDSLTVRDFDNLMSGTQIPQGPSHSQAQFTIGTGESSYDSSKTALCKAINCKLDFKLITEEGGKDLINFLLTQSTKGYHHLAISKH